MKEPSTGHGSPVEVVDGQTLPTPVQPMVIAGTHMSFSGWQT
jgi:hypothetical protein